MKKFSEWIGTVREAEQKKVSDMQLSHKDYMNAKLEKFGAKTISELDEEKKNEFFAEIVAEFESTNVKEVVKEEETPAKEEEVKETEETPAVDEAEVKSDADFKEYATNLLKKAHGDDFDQAKADEVIDGILKKCGDDYGACVGMITASLGK